MFGVDDAVNAYGGYLASQQQQQQIQNAQGLLGNIYGQTSAMQQPWIQSGQQTLGQLMQGLRSGAFQANVTPQNLAQDPGYQFQMQQGQQALARSAAAKGQLNSGAFAKGLDQYSQGLAAQQYQNAWQRQFQQGQANYQDLMGVTGMGLGAAQNVGALGQGYGNSMANLYGSLGNAQAAGTMAVTNGISGAFRDLGSLAMGLVGM